jgi:hypothetical protein
MASTMASTVIKANPDLSNFISLNHEQILKIRLEEATALKKAGDELYKPLTPFSENYAFINFSAAIHNSIPFFEAAGVALAKVGENRKMLSTTPLIKSNFHYHNYTHGEFKKDFLKRRAHLQILTDYKKAKDDYIDLLKGAHWFMFLAHDSLLRSLSEF